MKASLAANISTRHDAVFRRTSQETREIGRVNRRKGRNEAPLPRMYILSLSLSLFISISPVVCVSVRFLSREEYLLSVSSSLPFRDYDYETSYAALAELGLNFFFLSPSRARNESEFVGTKRGEEGEKRRRDSKSSNEVAFQLEIEANGVVSSLSTPLSSPRFFLSLALSYRRFLCLRVSPCTSSIHTISRLAWRSSASISCPLPSSFPLLPPHPCIPPSLPPSFSPVFRFT